MCISWLLYPAMMTLDTDAAVRFFGLSYLMAVKQQPGLLIISAAASIGRLTLTQPESTVAYAHLLNVAHPLFSPIYTVLFMVKENNALVAAAGKKTEELRGMLERWGPRSDVRMYAGLLMFLTLVLVEINANEKLRISAV